MDVYTGALTQTPQSQPVPGRGRVMTKNRAGGYTFKADLWTRLDRFLILGTENGTYYASERTLTLENARWVEKCIAKDGPRTVARIVEISEAGRAIKNEPALFALAIAIRKGDVATRRLAADSLPKVARTATHLFDFLAAVKTFGGFPRVVRRAVANWYLDKKPEDVAYQMVKYRERNGWTHKDALLLARVNPPTPAFGRVFDWLFKEGVDPGGLPSQIVAFEAAKAAPTARAMARLIYEANLPREAVPDKFLKSKEVWEALLQRMPMHAAIRQLGRMTALGLLGTGSEWADALAERLTSDSALKSARVHPMQILMALRTYQEGHGHRLSWEPNRQIVTALDEGFYKAFRYVEPTGKRFLVGVDISGSMTVSQAAGMKGFTAAQAAAVIAMCLLRSEPHVRVIGYDTRAIELEIDREMRLMDVTREINRMGGGTDCAVPLRWARQRREQYDAFVLITDNETWAGPTHAVEELNAYRQAVGAPAYMVTAAMTANHNTVGDTYDPYCLDIVGCDANVPKLISEFVQGHF